MLIAWLALLDAPAATFTVCSTCAYPTLDDALFAARDGDVVHLREPGLYDPTQALSHEITIEGRGPDTRLGDSWALSVTAPVRLEHLTLAEGSSDRLIAYDNDLTLVDVDITGGDGRITRVGELTMLASRLSDVALDSYLLDTQRAHIERSVVRLPSLLALADEQLTIVDSLVLSDETTLPPSTLVMFYAGSAVVERTLWCGSDLLGVTDEGTVSRNNLYLGWGDPVGAGPALGLPLIAEGLDSRRDLFAGTLGPLATSASVPVMVADAIVAHNRSPDPLFPDAAAVPHTVGPLLVHDTDAALSDGSLTVTDLVQADPLFVQPHVPGACDAAAYQLQAGSPGIDLGPFAGAAPYVLDRDRDGAPGDVDCDDDDPTVYPDAYDACGDGIDADCDGIGELLTDDEDGDGLSTQDELGWSDPCVDDTDGDGLLDDEELLWGTDPEAFDSDSDGLWDGKEELHGTSPVRADHDDDGLLDGVEVDEHGTDPLNPDTDGDLLDDGVELLLGTDPLLYDTDDDGLSDADEVIYGSDPHLPDTDGDGLLDVVEALNGSDPALVDTDGDGLDDFFEHLIGSDPTLTDTDGDGLDDPTEWSLGTDPALADTDGDGLDDRYEVDFRLDPLVDDIDDDGLLDGDELAIGSDPLDPDSDDDGVLDGDDDDPLRAPQPEPDPTVPDPTVPEPTTPPPTDPTGTPTDPVDAPPSGDTSKRGCSTTAVGPSSLGPWLLAVVPWMRRRRRRGGYLASAPA